MLLISFCTATLASPISGVDWGLPQSLVMGDTGLEPVLVTGL